MSRLATYKSAPLVLTVLLSLSSGGSEAQQAPSPPRKVAEVIEELTDIKADHRPLVEVIVDLERRHNLPILFDNDIVPGSAAYGEPHVTCDIRKLPLGEALHRVLSGVDLDYVVRKNDLLIVTQEKARRLNRWPTGSTKSANDARISEALEESTEFDFDGDPLGDVMQYLGEKHGIDIQLDERALKDAKVGTETLIRRSVEGVTLESALDLVLSGLDLTWLIHDEVLLITSTARANGLIETRVYPVLDLVIGPPGTLPPIDGPDYDALVDILSEAAVSGQGEGYLHPIRVYRPSGALVITWPVASHRRVEKVLAGLRRAKAAQMGSP